MILPGSQWLATYNWHEQLLTQAMEMEVYYDFSTANLDGSDGPVGG